MTRSSARLAALLLLAACAAPPGRRPEPEPVRGARPNAPVMTGLDVLVASGFEQLRGAKVGLITNQTGIDRAGVSNVTLFAKAPGVELVTLFSPEHGFQGKLEGKVANGTHPAGFAIQSLYGDTRKPTPEMLAGIDCLVFDIQDIGTRFYTYISTMGLAMQAAAEAGIRFVVLDRPNPIGATKVAGPVLDAGTESFVGFHTIPVRHGMTIGELATMFAAELPALRGKQLRLQVIGLRNYSRDMRFDETGLTWINPSPNMRNLNEALLYPGIGLLETTNISVGRGTDTPFERIGAPWIDGPRLAAHVNSLGLPGFRCYPIDFTPTASKFEGVRCEGLFLIVDDRDVFEPVRTGLHIACALRDLFPGKWQIDRFTRLLRNADIFEGLEAGKSAEDLIAMWQPKLREFERRRKAVLLYP